MRRVLLQSLTEKACAMRSQLRCATSTQDGLARTHGLAHVARGSHFSYLRCQRFHVGQELDVPRSRYAWHGQNLRKVQLPLPKQR